MTHLCHVWIMHLCFISYVLFCKRLFGNGHPSSYTHTQMPLWFKEYSHQRQNVAVSFGVVQRLIRGAERLTPLVVSLVARCAEPLRPRVPSAPAVILLVLALSFIREPADTREPGTGGRGPSSR